MNIKREPYFFFSGLAAAETLASQGATVVLHGFGDQKVIDGTDGY